MSKNGVPVIGTAGIAQSIQWLAVQAGWPGPNSWQWQGLLFLPSYPDQTWLLFSGCWKLFHQGKTAWTQGWLFNPD